MITILTDYKHLKSSNVYNDINFIFEEVLSIVPHVETFLTKEDISYLVKVDKIKKLNGEFIETPFGGTNIGNLSTGSKTMVLLSYLDWAKKKDIIVSLNGCGANVLELIFKDERYKDNTFFLTHKYLPDAKVNPFIVEGCDIEFTNLGDYLQYCIDLEIGD